jgi:uncharacterized protein (TIGR03382 family)
MDARCPGPNSGACTDAGVYTSCSAGSYAEQDCTASGLSCDATRGCYYPEDPVDTDEPGDTDDTDVSEDTDPADTDDTDVGPPGTPRRLSDGDGCGCGTGVGVGWVGILAVAGIVGRRRR